MATPIPALVETSDPPLSTDSDAQFDAKAFPWAASLDPFGQSVSAIAIAARENAEEALAAALGGDLPPLTGEALKFLRVKADESGAEFAEVPEPVTQPTADWEAGTSTTEGIVSPAKVKAAIDEYAIGIGQTWQDVTASRSLATDYTNNTGKPIEVQVTCGSTTGNAELDIYVDSVQINEVRSSSGRTYVSFTVPDGSTYKAEANTGLDLWAELR